VYRKAIEINPNNYEDYYELGEIYIQQKNWEQAISYFIKTLQLKLNYFKSYHKLAEILEKQGNKKAAYRCKYHHILPKTMLVKFCQLPPDYAIESQTFPGIKYIEIYPATKINLSPSKTINKNVISPLKRKEIIAAPAFVAEIDGGRAWAHSSIGAVITSDNKLVTDICTGSAELVLSSSKLRPCHSIDGTVAFFSLRSKKLGFFHWMFDVVARFDLLFRSGITISEIDKFVVNNCKSNFQRETFKILGVPEERVIESDSYPHIKAKRLVVPSIHAQAENNFRSTKWACDFIKNKFLDREALDKLPRKNERIYISRRLASKRRIINEEEVVSLLEKFGFISVTLESMSIAEQALCLANAKVVVGPHGAGLTNLLFCQPGIKVIEIFSKKSTIDIYWLLSNICGLDHYYLIGDKFDDSYFLNPGCKDILVNLDSLLKLMRLVGIA
ncbi:MAG: DUF563 domain-containing protein, partial [Okeania sp. SIO2H7]|nr:DUF563 domain-containing protein [Okeania sp. SIO2H7]